MRHTLEPSRATLHGKFSPDLDPALTVDRGDTVVYRTLDISFGRGQHVRGEPTRPKWGPRESPRDDGPALHGPVYVRGALAGSTLVAHLEEIRPADWGWTYSGQGPFNRALNEAVGLGDADSRLLLWELDADAMVGTSERGHRVELRPFMGTIGLTPAGSGWHEGWFPTPHGGNMDCKELVAGTMLYLPVGVDGGLVSLGDGHARQGDGELAGTAIECPMERVVVRYDVETSFSVDVPTARTPSGWVTLGFSRDLDEAAAQAVSGMLDVLERELEVDRQEAMLLASVVVDVRITQLVNGVRGVHAVFDPDDLLG
ncbi:acetamidase [Persicimonas caeni]|uniref:Acetamidase n=1 Tax=Persicimonas caeni TaxID=2292766 RepID=A0A4Y6PLS3_PERCE|nr:acetamidase/formamidase family protein [Persicimonas caeni]QDG49212.1 acetamidase [Persicimonas caeni]QED30433.1 acetamidase [Persicimonas caeni]